MCSTLHKTLLNFWIGTDILQSAIVIELKKDCSKGFPSDVISTVIHKSLIYNLLKLQRNSS